MLRWLFIQLIWLHPAPFRWRFGDDMLDDFDRAPSRARPRYLADAVASLARQWLLRPEFRHPDSPAATADALLAVPLFQTIETYRPRPAALLQGGLLAILSILAAVILIGKGGGVAQAVSHRRAFFQAQSLADRPEFGGRQRPQHHRQAGTGPLRGVAEARPALLRFAWPCCVR